jgi:hypothetical protein
MLRPRTSATFSCNSCTSADPGRASPLSLLHRPLPGKPMNPDRKYFSAAFTLSSDFGRENRIFDCRYRI